MMTTFAIFKSEIKSSTRASKEIINSMTQKAMIRSYWCWFGIYIPTILSFLALQCIKIKVCENPYVRMEKITTMQVLTWILFIIAFFVVLIKCGIKWGTKWGIAGAVLTFVIHVVVQTILSSIKKWPYSIGTHSSSGC